MALGFRKGSVGFPPGKECWDYQSLQRAAFLTDYVQSVLNNRDSYSQDTGAALTRNLINSRATKVLEHHPSTCYKILLETKLVVPEGCSRQFNLSQYKKKGEMCSLYFSLLYGFPLQGQFEKTPCPIKLLGDAKRQSNSDWKAEGHIPLPKPFAKHTYIRLNECKFIVNDPELL